MSVNHTVTRKISLPYWDMVLRLRTQQTLCVFFRRHTCSSWLLWMRIFLNDCGVNLHLRLELFLNFMFMNLMSLADTVHENYCHLLGAFVCMLWQHYQNGRLATCKYPDSIENFAVSTKPHSFGAPKAILIRHMKNQRKKNATIPRKYSIAART